LAADVLWSAPSARSSFYFLALTLAPGDQDYAYDVRDLEAEIGMIADAGWEVGLHGGHWAYSDPEALETEKRRLEGVPVRSPSLSSMFNFAK
jgi:peptidoglycan/xylan/chitin deacetylase (PgdA/CDA1 family)